jgi:gamma-glutamyltranspeptidase / glutathione hydrolase
MTIPLNETWTVTKPSVTSDGGLVASQHHEASQIGAAVLEAGGNAVDAAVATGLAIGVAEPWMSGLGGCGYMVIHDAETRETHAVDFATVAPKALDPATYPLDAGQDVDADLFGWPRVVDDRNVQGPHSVGVPSLVAGHAMALEKFGTLAWSDVLAPAIALAERGMKIDWYATLRIAMEAPGLVNYPASRDFFLPGGLPALSLNAANLEVRRNEALIKTLKRLAEAGPEDFYRGDIARTIAKDMAQMGGSLASDDLAAYRAGTGPAASGAYRDVTVHVPTGLNAGPTLLDTFTQLAGRWTPGAGPDAETYLAYGEAMTEAYERRFASLGDSDQAGESCTTHLTVIDRKGNIVALTQTLLSVFGSRVMLPGTGILMNNGIMWFDPRPGSPNSLAPGKRPLSNMVPTVVTRADGSGLMGLGASGGRRIMAAVAQLVSFVADFGMDLDRAFATPRIDVSGEAAVTVDVRLDPAIRRALAERFTTVELPYGVTPALYACPNAVRDDGAGHHEGAAFIMSPWAKVAAGG